MQEAEDDDTALQHKKENIENYLELVKHKMERIK